MRSDPPTKMYPVRHACKVLGVSYPALKQWIYKGKIKTVKTPGGHHLLRDLDHGYLRIGVDSCGRRERPLAR